VLVWLDPSPRPRGFLTLVFAAWYGAMRVITDFLRVDRRYLGLTGSQLLALATVATALYLLARHRGAPPTRGAPRWWGRLGLSTTERSREGSDDLGGRPGEHSA
jgi:hypothetical protein